MNIINIYIRHDYETSERAGAGGMFQVIACRGEQEDGGAVDFKVDAGIHFHSNQEVLEYLIKEYPKNNFSATKLCNDD